MIKRFFKKCCFIVLCVILFCNSVFASGASEGSISSGSSQMVDALFIVFAAIPAAYGGMHAMQAFLAYREAKSESGGANAQGKLSDQVVLALICFALAGLIFSVFKPAIKTMLGMG